MSAALLSRELSRSGITSTLADAGRIRLVTEGSILNAEPVGLDTLGLIRLLEDQDVVVVPGFLGRDIHGRTTLLGRGGSDLTAVYIANQLDAPCILLKDVDGIFEEDPALSQGKFRGLSAYHGKPLWRLVGLSFRARLSSTPLKMGHL